MRNKQAIVDFLKEEITLKFDNELFIINMKEGDKEDNWNSFTTKKGIVRDINFHISLSKNSCEIFLSVYPLIKNDDGTYSTDMENGIKIKIAQTIGNVGKYLNIPFDGVNLLYFEVINKFDGGVFLKTKSFNRAVDTRFSARFNLDLVAIDMYGNRKKLNNF